MIRQCSQVHEVETVAVVDKGEQTCKERDFDNAKTGAVTTKGMQEDVQESN